jgi:hypothetical protein
MIVYTRRLKAKDGHAISIKIFAKNRTRFIWAFCRGWFEYGRSNSYEMDDSSL